MQVLQEFKSFDGFQQFIAHDSYCNNCVMRFSLYKPPQLIQNPKQKLPVMYFLSGMTSSDENFTFKSGMQALAARYGFVVVVPDTSPRGDDVDDHDEPNLGHGASFFVNATTDPWRRNYQMYDYIFEELPALIAQNLPIDAHKTAIMGHSMGGHAAILLALRHSDKYQSLSAIAPLASLMQCSWGEMALANYLGNDPINWAQYDACVQMQQSAWDKGALIDYGMQDPFENQVNSALLAKMNERTNMDFDIRFHHGYDHSYFFIASVLEDHFAYHMEKLNIELSAPTQGETKTKPAKNTVKTTTKKSTSRKRHFER